MKPYISENIKNYGARAETILICSWNTIRLTDIPIFDFIDNRLNKNNSELIKKFIAIERPTVVPPYYNLTENEYYSIIKQIYPKEYLNAPITKLYELMFTDSLKPIKTIIVAHNTFADSIPMDNLSEYMEPMHMNITYDGTVESIEELITKYSITCIVIDDIDYLYEILCREKIDITGMTFIFPRIGYNFERNDDGILDYKYQNKIDSEMINKEFEIAFADLYEFEKEELMTEINKYKGAPK